MLLRDLGMSAGTEWRAVERQLRDLGMDAPGALEPKERQRLFLEVRGELAAEQGFKTLLESASDISAGTSWPLAKRQVWTFACTEISSWKAYRLGAKQGARRSWVCPRHLRQH